MRLEPTTKWSERTALTTTRNRLLDTRATNSVSLFENRSKQFESMLREGSGPDKDGVASVQIASMSAATCSFSYGFVAMVPMS